LSYTPLPKEQEGSYFAVYSGRFAGREVKDAASRAVTDYVRNWLLGNDKAANATILSSQQAAG